jgi:hypothetical protein
VRKRHRIAALENLLRVVSGQAQLVSAIGTASASATPQRISIQPAIETDTAMPIQAAKSVRIQPATETDTALPIVAAMGPVTVRVGREFTLRYDIQGGDVTAEVTLPDTPERQAAAFGTAAAGMGAGALIADALKPGYGPLGGLVGWWYGVRLWNRWSRGT